MKHSKKLWVIVVAALVIGLLFAYAGVGIAHVTRPCTSAEVPKGESISRCETVEKVFMHPRDLFSNKQDKLLHFSETFVIASLASFALFSVLGLVRKKKA